MQTVEFGGKWRRMIYHLIYHIQQKSSAVFCILIFERL